MVGKRRSEHRNLNVSGILSHAEKACEKSGSRLTEKRKRILVSLLQSQKALSAYDIVSYMREEFNESIPPMSVYRILDFLVGENFAHKLDSENKYIACSHIACSHTHEIPQFLICDNCGQVKEIGVQKSVVERLEMSVEEAGFFLKGQQLELRCICLACKKQKE